MRALLILVAAGLALGCSRAELDDGFSTSLTADIDGATGADSAAGTDDGAGPDGPVEAEAAASCPASIAEFCAQAPVPCPTWSSAQDECTHSPLARIAKSCGGYYALSESGPPDTGSTTFYFDPATGDLVGIVKYAGLVPPPNTGAAYCTIPSSFSAPTCAFAACTPAPDTTPITGLTAGAWTWVPFPQALCRDGSSTGIGVNLGTSDRLMIFLEGGGACFNSATCAGNPSSFGNTAFNSRVASTTDEVSVNAGILDRNNTANPVKDWSFVYIPYCTGDLHAGNNVAAVSGVGPPPTTQHFVGYANVGLYLDRIVPTFPNAAQVLLTGLSAGGFGAAFNYAHVAKAFGSTPVTMLDDSGPFMGDPYFATCLQSNIRTLWGLDGTVLADCGSDCTTPSSFFLDYVRHVTRSYPKVAFGLADSTDDDTITTFYGWGMNTCTGTTALTGATFTAGLLDIRTQLASQSNFGEFIFAGTDHTTIQSAAFYTRSSGGQDGGAQVDGGAGNLMTGWVTGLLGGAAPNTGP